MLARSCYLVTLATAAIWGSSVLAAGPSAATRGTEPKREPTFDPSDYLKQRGFEIAESAASLRHGLVVVDGVVYRRFESSAGSVIVPMAETLRLEDLQRARCLRDSETPYAEAEPGSVREAKLNAEIARRAEAIKATIKTKCGPPPAGGGDARVEPHSINWPRVLVEIASLALFPGQMAGPDHRYLPP